MAATLRELGDSTRVKSIVTSALTAGLLEKIGGTSWVKNLGSNTQTALDDKIFKSLIDNTASAIVQTGVQGGSLSDNLENALKSGLITTLHGEAASHIKSLENTNWLLHKIAHAAAGCVASALQKDCEAGAIGAAVGEAISELAQGSKESFTLQEKETIIALSKILAGTVAAYAGYDTQIAIQSAGTAVETNSWGKVIKIGAKVVKVGVKNGKVELRDIKKILKDEGYSIIDNLITLTDGHLTFDDAKAIVDIVVGTDFNTANKGKALEKINEINNLSKIKISILDKIRGIRSHRYSNISDEQLIKKIEYTMTGSKTSVINGKVLYLSPNKKDILIYDPNNPMSGTIFPNDRDNKRTNEYIRKFIIDNGGVKIK